MSLQNIHADYTSHHHVIIAVGCCSPQCIGFASRLILHANVACFHSSVGTAVVLFWERDPLRPRSLHVCLRVQTCSPILAQQLQIYCARGILYANMASVSVSATSYMVPFTELMITSWPHTMAVTWLSLDCYHLPAGIAQNQSSSGMLQLSTNGWCISFKVVMCTKPLQYFFLYSCAAQSGLLRMTQDYDWLHIDPPVWLPVGTDLLPFHQHDF